MRSVVPPVVDSTQRRVVPTRLLLAAITGALLAVALIFVLLSVSSTSNPRQPATGTATALSSWSSGSAHFWRSEKYAKLQVVRAQSGDVLTFGAAHPEQFFDLGNTDVAGPFGDPTGKSNGWYSWSCDVKDSTSSVVIYTLEVDTHFRSYQGFNGGQCTMYNCTPDGRVGYEDGAYSLPGIGQCGPCQRIGDGCYWKIHSIDKIVLSSCLRDADACGGAPDKFKRAVDACPGTPFSTSHCAHSAFLHNEGCPFRIGGCVGASTARKDFSTKSTSCPTWSTIPDTDEPYYGPKICTKDCHECPNVADITLEEANSKAEM